MNASMYLVRNMGVHQLIPNLEYEGANGNSEKTFHPIKFKTCQKMRAGCQLKKCAKIR